ncbi:MAG: Ig-like domain-containing protein [Lachnospiraceae bacterium]|nr:Ig-like domain-containing protein [Lachnospiraceae bacterium]
MAFVMALSLMTVSTPKVMAQEAGNKDYESNKISLGTLTWSNEKADYSFPDADIDVNSGSLSTLCVSVDKGGTFSVGNVSFPNATFISGITANGAYSNTLATGEYESVSIKGSLSPSEIEAFLQGLTFHRNTNEITEFQRVSVFADSVELDDHTSVMLIDGTPHYYKYVNVSASAIDWFDAYAEAKNSTLNGMKGYLATVTSDVENRFVYRSVNDVCSLNSSSNINAWIGGIRTHITDSNRSVLDAEAISANNLNLGDGLNYETPRNWYWICGPEAGKSFYTTNIKGNSESAPGTAMTDIKFESWETDKPDNMIVSYDKYDGFEGAQACALALGHFSNTTGDDPFWDDYYPNYTGNYWEQNEGHTCAITGYIVEYSSYGNIKPTVAPCNAIRYVSADAHDYNKEDLPGTERIVTISCEDFNIDMGSGFINSESLKTLGKISAVNDLGANVAVSVNTDDLLALNERIANGPAGSVSVRLTAEGASKTLKVTVESVAEDDDYKVSVTVLDPANKNIPLITGPDKTITDKNVYNIVVPNEETGLYIVTSLESNNLSFDQTYGDSTNKGVKSELTSNSIKLTAVNAGVITLSDIAEGDNGKVSVKVNAGETNSMIYEFNIEREETEVVEEKDVTIEAEDFSIKASSSFLSAAELIKESKAKAYLTEDNTKSVPVTVDSTDLETLNSKIFDAIPGESSVKLYAGNKTKTITVTITADDNTDMKVDVADKTGELSNKITKLVEEKTSEKIYRITVPYDVKEIKITNSIVKNTADFDNTYGTNGILNELVSETTLADTSTPGAITLSNLKVGENGDVSVRVKAQSGTTMTYTFNITRDLCDNANISADNFDVPFGSNFLNASDIIKKASIKAFDKDENELAVTVDSDSLLVLNERIVKGPSGIVTVKLVAGKTTKLMKVTIRPDDSTDASVSVSDPDGKNSPLLSLISAGEENRKKFIINLPCEEDKLVINTTLTDSTSSFDLTYGTDGVLAGDDATVVYTSPKKITLSNIPEGKAFTVSVQVKAENGDKLVYEYTIEREKAPVVEEDVTITVQNESIQVKVGGDYIKAKDILEGTGATASTTGGKTVSVAVDSDDLLNLNEKMIKGTTGSCDVYLYAGNAQAKITVDIQPVGNTAIGVQVSDPVGSYEPECSDPVRTKQANTRQYSITLPYYETAVKIDLTLDQNASVSDEYGENGLETDLKQTATAEKTTDTSITVSHVAVGDNGKISLKVVVDENTYMIYEFAITRDDCSDAEFEKSANTPSFRKSTTGFVKENDIITTGEVKAKDKNGTELKVTVDNNDLLILNERLQNDIAGKVSIKLYAGNTKGSIDVMVLADDNTDAQIAVTDPDETYFPRVKGTEVKDGKTTYKLLLPSGEDKLKIETKLAKTTSSFDQTYGTNGINTTSLKTGIAIAADSPSSIVLSDIPEGECGSVSIKVVAADETSMIYEFMISREKAPEVEPEKTVIISLEVSDFEIEAGSVILYSSDFEEKAKISCTDTEDNKVAYEINADDLINLNNEIKDVSNKEDRTVAVKVTTGKITKTVKVKVTPKKEDAGGEGQDGQDDQGKENDNPDGTDIVDPDGKGQDNPDDQIDDKPQKQTVVTITAEDFEVELGSNTLTVDEIIKRANASAKDDEGKTVEMNVQMFDLITLNSYIEGDKEREYSLTIYAGSAKKTITVKLVPKKQTEKKEDSEKKADEETKESSEAPAETKEQTVETKVEDDAFVIELSKTIAVKDKNRFTFVGVTKKDSVTYRSSKKKIATVSKKGVVVGKKVGTTVITAIIKKGTFSYKVKLNLKVVKATNAMDKLISIKKKGLMKKTGKLPELNVYEAVNAGKNIKLKFSNLAKDAKLECVSDNKNVKIAKLSLSKKKKTATITVKGQKRGFSHVTVKVNQGGRFYYVRYLIRVKSGKWTLKQLKTYLN